ncbi:MAG: mechanosensitive ion channel [bacterium]|nr:mechanosensitive ion channel [bacterium]
MLPFLDDDDVRAWVRSRVGTFFLVALFGVALAGPAAGQNPLLGALDASEEGPAAAEPDRPSDADPLSAIEIALTEARSRLAALTSAQASEDEEDGEPLPPSASIELANRLVRVLEQRREAQLKIDALEVGRSMIESGLARDPSEIVADPPPFPVPTLDGVLQAWRDAAREEEKTRSILEDRRANLDLARKARDDLARERRRVKDVLEREKQEVERIRLRTELRVLEDQLRIANEQVLLAEQRVASVTIEHDIHVSMTRQTRAALTWVETQLQPRESDLTDAIARLDRERLDLDRELDLKRSRLVAAEGTLRTTEERRGRVDAGRSPDFALELATRRAQLSHRQEMVSLLSERIERLARMRTTWQHRYAVLGPDFDLEAAPGWRAAANLQLERLQNLQRIHETERAEAQLAQADLLRRSTEVGSESPSAQRFLELEFEDLDELVALYDADLLSFDAAIALEERLVEELTSRMKRRSLSERARSAWATITSFWTRELTTSQDSPITPGKIAIALAVFVFGLYVARLVRSQLRQRFFPQFGFDAGASSAFASLTFYALMAVAFLLALQAVNIPLTAFAVAGGALAIGIGFGSQTVISNFISGLLLLAERPIRTGDLVEVGGVVGTVDTIGLRSTRIQTPDNFHIIVPNAAFLESNVVNWTHEDPLLRLRVSVGVAYGSPAREVEALLLRAASEHPRCLRRPSEPSVIFQDFGDSALLFEVRFWVRYTEQTDRAAIRSDIRYRIDELFAEHGIVIAFPQMDVHLDVAGKESS